MADDEQGYTISKGFLRNVVGTLVAAYFVGLTGMVWNNHASVTALHTSETTDSRQDDELATLRESVRDLTLLLFATEREIESNIPVLDLGPVPAMSAPPSAFNGPVDGSAGLPSYTDDTPLEVIQHDLEEALSERGIEIDS